MIALVYDSLFGNTAIIARKLADTVKAQGYELVEMKVSEYDLDILKKSEVLIVGSPTQSFNASKPMLEFLEKVDVDVLRNKKAIVFDTRIALESIESKFLRWLVNRGGFATAPITKRLKKKGASVIAAEGFIVTDREGPLADGETERAEKWLSEVLNLQNLPRT